MHSGVQLGRETPWWFMRRPAHTGRRCSLSVSPTVPALFRQSFLRACALSHFWNDVTQGGLPLLSNTDSSLHRVLREGDGKGVCASRSRYRGTYRITRCVGKMAKSRTDTFRSFPPAGPARRSRVHSRPKWGWGACSCARNSPCAASRRCYSALSSAGRPSRLDSA